MSRCDKCMEFFPKTCMTSYYGSPPSWPPDPARYLDKEIYQLRIRHSVFPFLACASELGARHREGSRGQRGAHARVKGLGLGAWWVDPVQESLMYAVYETILQEGSNLQGIDVLDFSFFPTALPASVIAAGAARGIEVIATQSGFAEPAGGCLLVAMYAWDGNAYPGNEWWAESGSQRYLGMTDDSAAASCSLITSLQHPGINGERLCYEVASFY
ncbi:MSH2 [Symbiodinium natans]|uniref:MSH2 protein n=1 Tax=Symbiodinium natans TaxID=878477 RepID=A0A812RBS6_9DINO|nr:MSH2 [Symbiodinium natans]